MFGRFVWYVGKNFGNPGGRGGKLAAAIMNVMNRGQYGAILEHLKPEAGSHILDIGFGNGYLLKKLAAKNIPAKLWGVEISADMLRVVSAENEGHIRDGTMRLLLEDISRTSFGDSLFDRIYTVNTLYFWTDPDRCFSEIRRILKPGGVFLNAVYTKEYLDRIIFAKYGFGKYTVEEIQAMTERNGLKVTETAEIRKDKSYCIVSENMKPAP